LEPREVASQAGWRQREKLDFWRYPGSVSSEPSETLNNSKVEGVGPSNPRDHRIDELRQRIERLRERIAAAQAEQRRAVMELAELLEEARRMARRAQREQRAERLRQDKD
jgi:hypothetical protein